MHNAQSVVFAVECIAVSHAIGHLLVVIFSRIFKSCSSSVSSHRQLSNRSRRLVVTSAHYAGWSETFRLSSDFENFDLLSVHSGSTEQATKERGADVSGTQRAAESVHQTSASTTTAATTAVVSEIWYHVSYHVSAVLQLEFSLPPFNAHDKISSVFH